MWPSCERSGLARYVLVSAVIDGLPIARRLIFHEADMYRCNSDGDVFRTSAMLSKP